MAKGNFGVSTLGNGAVTESSGKGTSLVSSMGESIGKSIVDGGFLPGAFEHGANTKFAKKGANSIANIAARDESSKNDIAAAFRESKKKQKR